MSSCPGEFRPTERKDFRHGMAGAKWHEAGDRRRHESEEAVSHSGTERLNQLFDLSQIRSAGKAEPFRTSGGKAAVSMNEDRHINFKLLRDRIMKSEPPAVAGGLTSSDQ